VLHSWLSVRGFEKSEKAEVEEHYWEARKPVGPGVTAFVLACFFLSGTTGLMYEVLWTRMLILIFGATTFAVSTVLTVFMGGLALGSYVLGRRLDRTGNPLVVYGWLELLVGVYALAAPSLFQSFVPVYRWVWAAFAPRFVAFSLIRFLLVGCVLLVPTFLMGGTLPALSRFCARRADQIGADVGRLYATNTFGAVVGTFVTGFILLPGLGVRRCTFLASAVSMALGGVVMLVASTRAQPKRGPVAPEEEAVGAPLRQRRAAAVALISLAAAGFTGMAYEVAWSRTLALVIGSSVYAFTTMLTSFLVGIALGSAVATAWLRTQREARVEVLILLHVLIGLSAYCTTFLFGKLPYTFTVLFNEVGERSQGYLWAIDFGIAFAVMLPATVFSGAVFPIAIRVLGRDLSSVGTLVGKGYACNTIGAIVGSFCSGWLLIPTIGIMGTVLFSIAANLCAALAGALVFRSGARRFRAAVGLALPVLVAAVFVWHPSWNRLLMSSGMYKYAPEIGKLSPESFYKFTQGGYILRFYKEGITTTVTVAEEKAVPNMWLATNGKIDASSNADMPTQVLSGELPLLLARSPNDVLVVGFASGVTVGSVLQHPCKRVVAIEIEKAVIEASHLFSGVNHRPWGDRRLTIVENDARNYLLVTDEKFDVIISEPSNPWISGPSNLFTREFFEIGRSRLRHGGLFCQWLQLYGMSRPNLRALMRTFQGVFPHVMVFETIEQVDLVLVGSGLPLQVDYRELQRRMRRPSVRNDLARVGVKSAADLLSYFKIGTRALSRFAGEGPLNTDDNALIEFSAPKSLYLDTQELNDREIEQHADCVAEYLSGYGLTWRERSAVLINIARSCKEKGRKRAAERLLRACMKDAPNNRFKRLIDRLRRVLLEGGAAESGRGG